MKEKTIIKTIIVIIAVIFFITGCGGKKVGIDPDRDYIFFPNLPNTPKYQYLTSFSTSKDVEKKKGKLFKFVAGKDEAKTKFIRKPYGVDIFEGVVYVCDLRSNAIVTLDLKKKSFGYIGTRGAGKLKKPANLVIDKEKKIIYVTDTSRDQVIIFDINGKYLRSFGFKGQFKPSDIRLYKDRLYICDVKGSQIYVLNRDSGEVLFKISSKGHHEGELFHPTNIKIYNRKLFVSDTTNFRISIFDLEGNYIEKFGSIGKIPGKFARPKGIDIDREGNIYVVDSAFENVQVIGNPEFCAKRIGNDRR